MLRFASLDKYTQSGIVGLISAFGGGVLGVLVHPSVRELQPTTTDSVVQVAVISGLVAGVLGAALFVLRKENRHV